MERPPKRHIHAFKLLIFEDVFNWPLKYLELQFHTSSQVLNTCRPRLQICRPPADVLKTSPRARWGFEVKRMDEWSYPQRLLSFPNL